MDRSTCCFIDASAREYEHVCICHGCLGLIHIPYQASLNVDTCSKRRWWCPGWSPQKPSANKAGQIHINHINISNLTTSCLDKFNVLLAFNGNSILSKQLVLKLFIVICLCYMLIVSSYSYFHEDSLATALSSMTLLSGHGSQVFKLLMLTWVCPVSG